MNTLLTYVVRGTGIAVIFLGLLLLAGPLFAATTDPWFLDRSIPTHPLLALAITIGGLGVALLGGQRERWVWLPGLVVVGLAAFLLASSAWAPSKEVVGPSTFASGTALCLIIFGSALVLVGGPRRRVQRDPAAVAGVMIGAQGTLALIGHLADIEAAWRFGELTRMSPGSALAAVLLGGALFAHLWSEAARRLMPLFAFGVVLTMTLYLWQVLATRDGLQRADAMQREAIAVRRQLAARLEDRLAGPGELVTLGRRRGDLNTAAAEVVELFPEVRGLEWIEGRTGERSPLLGRGEGLMSTADLRWDPGGLELVVGSARSSPAGPLLPVLIPIADAGSGDGEVVGGLLLCVAAEELFARLLRPELMAGSWVRVSEGGRELYGHEGPGDASKLPMSLGGTRFELKVWPSPEMEAVRHPRSSLPETILLAGLAIAILTGFVVRFAQSARHRAWEVAQLNAQLELRVEERTAELHAREEELRRSNQELEQFAYVASHDLQEPLRMVASYTGLLARRYRDQLDARGEKYIRYAVEGAQRMQILIDDLLELSRVETRGKDLAPTDCNEVLEEVLLNLEITIRDRKAQVEVEELPTLPADRGQLVQLFQNLISNGLKFCDQDVPRVRVTARRMEDTWRFEVHDNGLGIEAEYQERIFKIFQRLHDREAYAGSGMGLAICKKIVERHGGEIGVESKFGEGATFWFTLAAAEESV